MRTEAHWEETEITTAYRIAQQITFQVTELAERLGHDPRGVKVFSKKQIVDKGYGRANSVITWQEGPEYWADDIKPFLIKGDNVIANEKELVFYD